MNIMCWKLGNVEINAEASYHYLNKLYMYNKYRNELRQAENENTKVRQITLIIY